MRNYAAVIGLLCICVFHRSLATPAFGLAEFLHSKNKGPGFHGDSESKAGDGDHNEITTNEVQSSELENTSGKSFEGIDSAFGNTAGKTFGGIGAALGNPSGKTFGGIGAAFGNPSGKQFGGVGLVFGKTAGKPIGGLGSGLGAKIGAKLGAKLGHAIKELNSVVNNDEAAVDGLDSTHGNTTEQVEEQLDSMLTNPTFPLGENGGMNKFVNEFGQILPWGTKGRPTSLFGNSGSQGFYKGEPEYPNGDVGAYGGMFGDKQPSGLDGRPSGSYFPSSLTGSGYSGPLLARKKPFEIIICVRNRCWNIL